MKNKVPKIMLGLLLLATVMACGETGPTSGKADVIQADGMADSAATAAADLAKTPEPDKVKK